MNNNDDDEIVELEIQLEDAAALWRGTYSEDAVLEYHEIMKQLYAMGWDQRLAPQSLLPSKLMPTEYIRRNGNF